MVSPFSSPRIKSPRSSGSRITSAFLKKAACCWMPSSTISANSIAESTWSSRPRQSNSSSSHHWGREDSHQRLPDERVCQPQRRRHRGTRSGFKRSVGGSGPDRIARYFPRDGKGELKRALVQSVARDSIKVPASPCGITIFVSLFLNHVEHVLSPSPVRDTYYFFFVLQHYLMGLWMLAAVLLGMGGLIQERAVGVSSLTLALPVGRARLVGVQLCSAWAKPSCSH